jgi:hypothetical protein
MGRAALAPWKAAIARARKIKRLMRLLDRVALIENRGQDAMKCLPMDGFPGCGAATGARRARQSWMLGLCPA